VYLPGNDGQAAKENPLQWQWGELHRCAGRLINVRVSIFAFAVPGELKHRDEKLPTQRAQYRDHHNRLNDVNHCFLLMSFELPGVAKGRERVGTATMFRDEA
jgi:hypothetical protein